MQPNNAAYVLPQGIPSLERKLGDNAYGASLKPEWGEVRVVMREHAAMRRALRDAQAIIVDFSEGRIDSRVALGKIGLRLQEVENDG